jgi:hypothetical protein
MRPVDDPLSERWQKIAWTPWVDLSQAASTRGAIPREQGLYRVRKRDAQQLLYIGKSIRLAARLQGLERAIHRKDHIGHYAGGCIWRAARSSVQVSWMVMPGAVRNVLGREVDLIAAYRKMMGDSPRCQFAGDRLLSRE